MKEINRPARAGILLYGAPGTGKTHLVAAVAAKTALRLIVVKVIIQKLFVLKPKN